MKPVVPKNAVPISVSPLFTRRRARLTVGALLRSRAHWTRTPGGFRVTLGVSHEDQTTTRHVLSLTSQSNHFGGRRYYLICPACGRRVCSLYWREGFRCRTCAKLRYVSQTVSDDLRLMHHYAALREAMQHRPGPKPPRYFRYTFRETFHGTRGLRRVAGQIDALGTRARRRRASLSLTRR